MATIKEVYKLLKQKQNNGEKIGMFGESFIEMCEKDEEQSTTKEISVSLIKSKDGGNNGDSSGNLPIDQRTGKTR